MSMIKNLENLVLAQRALAPPTVISDQSKGPFALTEHVDKPNMDVDDVGVNVDFEMGEHRDVPEMST